MKSFGIRAKINVAGFKSTSHSKINHLCFQQLYASKTASVVTLFHKHPDTWFIPKIPNIIPKKCAIILSARDIEWKKITLINEKKNHARPRESYIGSRMKN